MLFHKLFKQDDDVYLLNQSEFNTKYRLISENTYIMGEENEPIKLKSASDVYLKQNVLNKKKIITTIKVNNIINESESLVFQEALKESELFNDIIPIIEIERNLRGEYLKINNLALIDNNWKKWKETKLPIAFPDPTKQNKIIENFENGLKVLDDQLKNNFQYMLLLPECYQFRDYYNAKDVSSGKRYSSRLIECLEIPYRLEKEAFKVEQNRVRLNLRLTKNNILKNEIEEKIIKFYKEYLPDYSFENYIFNISIKYSFDKLTSKILKARMYIIEELHPNLKYNISMGLNILD